MNIKLILLFIVGFLIGLTAIVAFLLKSSWIHTNLSIITPLPATLFSMKTAPSDTIDGRIASMSGKIEWQSRVASMPAILKRAIPLQQGETLITKNDGSATVNYPEIGLIKLAADSQLNVIQTLITSAVMDEPKGDIIYTKTGTIPLAIKSLGLLVQVASGSIEVTTDDQQQTVTVNILKGAATVAYTTTDDVSAVQNLHSGDTYYYNDATQQGSL